MDVMLQNKDYVSAGELGKLLYDHRGMDVLVMDMRPLDFWTDFFVIATVSSDTHLKGMEKHIKEFALENGLEILRHGGNRIKASLPAEYTTAEWHLVDLGSIVVHLMTDQTRSFFELERLWSSAPIIYKSETSTEAAGGKGRDEF